MKQLLMKLILGILIMSPVLAQTNQDERIKQAQALENDKKISEAVALYEQVHKDAPDNNAITFKLAGLAYGAGDHKEAVKYYKLLAPNGNPNVLYNLACSYAMLGKKRTALKTLEEAVEKGFNRYALMQTDPGLVAIRQHKKFAEILSSVKSIENHPEAKKFDFWVGDWNVFDPQNNQVGESKIEKILNDVVILENWSGTSGYAGKSFNHYHMDTGRWIQYWVDQSSERIYFEGNFDSEQNAMVYFEQVESDSQKPLRRLTFFNVSPDSVRQFSQLSSDVGKSWSVEYDFMYVRK